MNFKLVKTCGACPEQYDVFWEDKQVAYLRLRHGNFTAECPDSGGDFVYASNPRGDGIFEDDERAEEINRALNKVDKWCRRFIKDYE